MIIGSNLVLSARDGAHCWSERTCHSAERQKEKQTNLVLSVEVSLFIRAVLKPHRLCQNNTVASTLFDMK